VIRHHKVNKVRKANQEIVEHRVPMVHLEVLVQLVHQVL